MKTIKGILISKLLTVLGLFFPLVLTIGCNKLSNTYGVGQDKKRLKMSDSHVMNQDKENRDLIKWVFNITAFKENNNPLFFNDSEGRNVIHYAALYNQKDLLEIYLKTEGLRLYDKIYSDGTKDPNGYNAALNQMDKEGYTPFQLAVKKGNVEIVRLLINDERVNIHIQDKNRSTPLHLAASYNNSLEVVKELINHGANVNEKNTGGDTPLHVAAEYNSLEVVKELIKHRANINEKNPVGHTPLHLAAGRNSLEVVKELINLGANINEKNTRGDTPLHLAAKYNRLEMVKLLLEHPNIQINAKNNRGKTAFDLAKDKTIIDLLSVKFDRGNCCTLS